MDNSEKNELATQETKQVVVAPEVAMLAMIERLVTNTDTDIGKMQAVMDMRDREFNRIAEQAFAEDYVIMKPHLPMVLKTKHNEQTKSQYATLDNINQEIDPVLSQYGFSTSTNILAQTDKDITVEAILWHRDGHKESTQLTLPIDSVGIKGTVNKTGVHATASSITYARRYAICTLLNISTGNDTDGNREPEAKPPNKVHLKVIQDLFDQMNPEEQGNFNKQTGGIDNLQQKDVDEVIASLKNTIREKT